MTKFVTAIKGTSAIKIMPDRPTVLTYANILLRPKPRRFSKSQPLRFSKNEVGRLEEILGQRGWGWALRDDPKQIYCRYMPGEIIKQTSVSGMYSGMDTNRFNVLEYYGKNWIKVETLKVGSDWWRKEIRPDLLHWVFTFKNYNPPCGPVQIPLLTYEGFAYVERWQVIE